MDRLQRGIASALRRRRHHLPHRMTRNERGVTPGLRVQVASIIVDIVGVALHIHSIPMLLLLLLLDGRLGGLRLRLRSGLGLDGDLYLLLRLWLRGDGRSWCLLWARLLLRLMCLLGGCGLGLVGLGLGLVWLVSLVSLVCDVLRLVC